MNKRLITGPILVLVLLGVVALDIWLERLALPAGLAFFVAGLFIVLPAGIELSRLAGASGIRTVSWLTALAGGAGFAVMFVLPRGTDNASLALAVLASLVVGALIAALVTFSRHENFTGVVASTATVVFAMVFLGLTLGFYLFIRETHSAWWLVGIVLTTKSCDIGAYATGRVIGRHRLIAWLSPGKTWEGLLGGIVLAAGVGALLASASGMLDSPSDRLPPLFGAACGGVFALVGQFGDLTVSLFKRDAGVKDSSALLPGMGGVLDVIDSLIPVGPVAFWLLIGVPG